MTVGMRYLLAFLVLGAVLLVFTFESPQVATAQQGYRGTGMVEVEAVDRLEALAASNQIPEPEPPASNEGPRASEIYENVQVLGDLSEEQFNRVMVAITNWVSPEEGCGYCHNVENLAEDSVYTKIVSRQMLRMTRHINADWKPHVAETGVTCYTCHRGQPVPAGIWFSDDDPDTFAGLVGNDAGQNKPAPQAGLTSLPADALTPYLNSGDEIRVVATQPLPTEGEGIGASIKETEETYSLMMHMSGALGVNCTYCHNTRSFQSWDQSRPTRTTAWHGIRMTRDLNVNYLNPLQSVFPRERLGPLGDVAKVNCTTCHLGAAKPLLGVSMAKDYPELVAVQAAVPAAAAPAAPADGSAAPAAPIVIVPSTSAAPAAPQAAPGPVAPDPAAPAAQP